jgi:uncharacterized protein YecE (DUF72 family)
MAGAAAHQTRIRVGIGGWTYEPWRNNFYPEGLAQARELEYASRQLGAIEINGTFYGSQKPASFAKWRDETPDDFMFSLKAVRYATHRKVLAEAGESVQRFIDSGIAELRHKLGPILWQFAATKRFEPDDFEAFLALLPPSIDGLALRHALDVRHESFLTPQYLKLARKYRCATVFTDSDAYPSFADASGDFVYARLMRTDAKLAHGCAPKALDRWADCARQWRDGLEPAGLPRIAPATAAAAPASAQPRDVFMFFISGAKEKAPAAAMALRKRLG